MQLFYLCSDTQVSLAFLRLVHKLREQYDVEFEAIATFGKDPMCIELQLTGSTDQVKECAQTALLEEVRGRRPFMTYYDAYPLKPEKDFAVNLNEWMRDPNWQPQT